MLEFALKEEYSLVPEMIRPHLNFDVDELQAFYFVNFLAVGDKRLIIHSRASPINYDNYHEAELILDLSNSEVEIKNITNTLRIRRDARYMISDEWRVCKLNTSLLFTRMAGCAKLFPNFGRGRAVDVGIENPLPNIKNSAGYPEKIRPNAWQRVIGQSSVLPMPITDGTKTRYICFLEVDADKHVAKWRLKQNPNASTPKNWFSHFWKTSKVEVTHKTLLKVSMSAFSNSSKSNAAIQSVMLKDGRIYIFTRGKYEQLHNRVGHAYSVIAQVDDNGKVLSMPFFQNHQLHDDQKKRGLLGSFTSSKKYCILKSIYAAADDWKGKQRLFDMDTNQIEELKLPRGYSKYQLVEHNGKDFWFQKLLMSRNELETKIIRCELV